MSNPDFVNGVNDIDIAINCQNLSVSSISDIVQVTSANTIRKVANLTITNYSATTTAGYKIDKWGVFSTEGTIFEGTLEPAQSVCLVDETRPIYIEVGNRIRGEALTANNCISVYCVAEVYS